MDCVESETGSCSTSCVTCDANRTEGVGIKVEEAIDIEDEIPEAISFSEIKTEHEVRLGVVCAKQWQLMLLRTSVATKEKF
jgi:hypothetical protein